MRSFIRTATLTSLLIIPGLVTAQESAPRHIYPIVDQLQLTDVEARPKWREDASQHISGTLPNGSRVEIELDPQGNVEEIESETRGGFPANAVEVLIPAAVRNHPSYPADASLRKLEFDDDYDNRIEIKGRLANGQKFEAKFRADGQLIKMELHD